MIYVYGKRPSYEETDWIGWTEDATEAAKRAEAVKDRYNDGVVMTLAPGGQIDYGFHSYVPEPYTGPVVRARVQFMIRDGCVHRVPVDCAYPVPYEEKLDADHLWRVVGTSVMPTADTPKPDGFSTCLCGDWQDIEGEPNAIAEMVAKYGVEGA